MRQSKCIIWGVVHEKLFFVKTPNAALRGRSTTSLCGKLSMRDTLIPAWLQSLSFGRRGEETTEPDRGLMPRHQSQFASPRARQLSLPPPSLARRLFDERGHGIGCDT
jgi:hypothetical protein